MPQPHIDQLLDELYQLDPTLRAHEAEVRTVIERLLRVKPHFTLSSQTLQQIQTSMMQPQSPSVRPPLPKMMWASIPLAIAAVVAGVMLIPKNNTTPPTAQTSGKVRIVRGPASAFGSFTASKHVDRSSTIAESAQGIKDAATTTASLAPTMGLYPVSANVVYTYDKSFTIPQSPVLQRERGFAAGATPASGGLADLSSFAGLRLDYVTATQQTDDGYSVTIDYRDGNISMYRNSGSVFTLKEATSIAPDRSTTGTTIKLSEAISSATAFAKKHGIDLSAYDEPTMQYWPGQQPQNDVVAAPVSIIFPLTINGLPVFDESGSRFGLMMTVEANGQVISVYNLTNHTYTSSQYTVTTSTKAITDFLGRGGYVWGGKMEGTKTTTIALQDPFPAYMISRYQVDQTPNEYLVPALVFGVTKSDQATTGRAGIVVPVLDQILTASANVVTPTIDLPASTNSGSAAGSTEPTSLPE